MMGGIQQHFISRKFGNKDADGSIVAKKHNTFELIRAVEREHRIKAVSLLCQLESVRNIRSYAVERHIDSDRILKPA